MTQNQTCGQGLAQHADLPRLTGDLLSSVAQNLTAHLAGLRSDDPDTQRERRVYEQLATRHREIAEMLEALVDEMVGYRDLPMGPHDLDALSSSHVTDALAGMIDIEAKLLELVERQLTEHMAILGQISGRDVRGSR